MTMRKPNFNMTDTGARLFMGRRRSRSRAWRSRVVVARCRWSWSDLKQHLSGAHLDAVPRAQLVGPPDGHAVDAHAVGRSKVLDRPGGPPGAQLGVAARDARVLQHDIAVATAPDRRAAWWYQQAPAGEHEQRLGAPPSAGALDRFANSLGVAEDHRVAAPFGLLGALARHPAHPGGRSASTGLHCPSLALAAWRVPGRATGSLGGPRGRRAGPRLLGGLLGAVLDPGHARFDAEFAERESLVGVERDARARGEREILAASVLQEIGAQLVDHLVLDTLVARSVLRGQPHRILVWRIHARHRGGRVLIHLARELARQLHRSDLGLEHATKGAFDKAGDHVLQCSQRIHCGGPDPCRREHPL